MNTLAPVEAIGPDDPELVSVLSEIRRAALFAARDKHLARSVTLALVSDDEIAVLNARFRGIPSATDVLTFPNGEGGGDIAIALGVAALQAGRRGQSLDNEAAILAIHGVLHLAGLDDLDDAARAEMQRETKRICDAAGIVCEDEWISRHDEGEL